MINHHIRNIKDQLDQLEDLLIIQIYTPRNLFLVAKYIFLSNVWKVQYYSNYIYFASSSLGYIGLSAFGGKMK